MKQVLRTSLTMMALIMMSACGPIMSTVVDYRPPIGVAGMHCVEKANQDRASCDSNNQIVLQQCIGRASADTDQAYRLAKDDYTSQLESYIQATDRYDYELKHFKEQTKLIINEGELKYIRCSHDIKLEQIEQFPKCKKFLIKANKRAEKLQSPRYPIKPEPPNKDVLYNQYQNNCNNSVHNCEKTFNQSYQSCGGTITYREVCVSNCD